MKTDATTRLGAAVLGICLGLAGCDAAVRGTQLITVSVAKPPGNTPVSGASIRCAPNNPCRAGASQTTPQGEYIAEFASEPVTTDDSGRANATLRVCSAYGSVYHTLLPFLEVPSTPRDEVSGLEYLFKVEDTTGTEFLTVLMKQGETVEGERFKLTVDTIGKPVRLKPDP